MHLLSRYIIRPSAFDRDPFFLPKNSSQNKYQHNNFAKNTNIAKTATQPDVEIDDFETVEAPKKKEKKIKPVAEELEESKEPEINSVAPIV